jgi:hypothetical protein
VLRRSFRLENTIDLGRIRPRHDAFHEQLAMGAVLVDQAGRRVWHERNPGLYWTCERDTYRWRGGVGVLARSRPRVTRVVGGQVD